MGTPVTLTEFLRKPNEVMERAADGPVRLIRRNGEDLVLIGIDLYQQETEGLRMAADVAAWAVTQEDSYLLWFFPWLTLLGTGDRRRFATEALSVARASAALSDFQPLRSLAAEWEQRAWRGGN